MRLDVIDNHRSRFAPIAPGWHQRKMRFAVKSYQTKKNEDENPTVLSLTKKGLKVKTDLSFGKSTESYVGHQLVERGQFVFTPRDFDATPILCGVADTSGCISNLYIVFDVSTQIDARFLEYYFWGLKRGFEFFEKLSFGMRYSFNRAQFENIPLLHPDLATQRQIADFLDRETARIDLLIENKQRFLHVLSEKVTATVESLVCGAISLNSRNDDGKLGGEHFQENGWILTPVKRVANIRGGYAFSSDDFSETGVQLIRIGSLYGNKLQLDRQPVFLPKTYMLNHSEFVVRKGDILMSLTGTLGKRDYGFSVLVDKDTPLLLNQRVARIRTNSRAINKYLLLALRTNFYLDQLYALPSGTKQANLSNDDVLNVKVPLPPLADQKRIVQAVMDFNAPLEAISQKTNASIERLKEYRSALITAAVTGQIDVTSYAKSGTPDAQLDAIQEELGA